MASHSPFSSLRCLWIQKVNYELDKHHSTTSPDVWRRGDWALSVVPPCGCYGRSVRRDHSQIICSSIKTTIQVVFKFCLCLALFVTSKRASERAYTRIKECFIVIVLCYLLIEYALPIILNVVIIGWNMSIAGRKM